MSTQTITIEHGKGKPKHAIIWLHGLGASANDFVSVVPELGLDEHVPIRFIFPQAPSRPITVNGGMVMPGWYDIKGMSINEKEDREGVMGSQRIVEGLIDEQIAKGIPSENIILAGFSQGGAVTYYTGLRSKRKLAGLLTLSTYMMFADDDAPKNNALIKKLPVFAGHGKFDSIVPLGLGDRSATKASELGCDVEWYTYPMEHQVMMKQIKDIGRWINKVFKSK